MWLNHYHQVTAQLQLINIIIIIIIIINNSRLASVLLSEHANKQALNWTGIELRRIKWLGQMAHIVNMTNMKFECNQKRETRFEGRRGNWKVINQSVQVIDWIQLPAYCERCVEITSPVTGGNVGGDKRLSVYELLYRITGWKQVWFAFNILHFHCEAENKLKIALERQQKFRNRFISFSKHVMKNANFYSKI
jgi:hypothetical protein